MSAGLALGERAPAAETPNETIHTIRGLRSIHGNFAERAVPEAALETILESSLRAANASNNQSYSIVVVKDPGAMKEICGYRGSCLLVYCADYNRLKASAASLGHTYDPHTIEDFVTASLNAALAAQTAVIAARSLGIDSLLTNGIHRGDIERQWKLLDLPQTGCFPLIAVVLGYAAKEPAYRMGRLDGPGVVHREKYHRVTSEEIVEINRKYDDRERHLALNDEWRKQGFRHYFDWFFKVWTARSARPAGQESPMLRRLRASGFVG